MQSCHRYCFMPLSNFTAQALLHKHKQKQENAVIEVAISIGSATRKDGCSNNLKARCSHAFRRVQQKWRGRRRKEGGGGGVEWVLNNLQHPGAVWTRWGHLWGGGGASLRLNSNHNNKVNRVIPVRWNVTVHLLRHGSPRTASQQPAIDHTLIRNGWGPLYAV